MKRTTWMAAVMIGLCGASFGCGAPEASNTRTTAAIRGADEVGAGEQPQAAYHLQLARDQVGTATRMKADGDAEGAERMLRRAQADAELAIALAAESRDREDAEALSQHIEDMSHSQL